VSNGKDTDDHKLQYFLNYLRRRIADWFARYGTIHPSATWDEVQRAFISRFSEIHNEGQVIIIYVKQKKYEFVKYYYDRLCVVIP
jgi:hypothetical protein